jgi:hypothetical protein
MACMEWRAVADFPGLSARLEPNASGRLVATGIKLEANPVTVELLRKIPLAVIEAGGNLPKLSDDPAALPPLRRDAGTDPQQFSKLVAERYKSWARLVPNPATAMARHAGVNPRTVHTWIREARLRGLLPPGRRGKG